MDRAWIFRQLSTDLVRSPSVCVSSQCGRLSRTARNCTSGPETASRYVSNAGTYLAATPTFADQMPMI